MNEPYGYVVQAGYIGYVDGHKMLFETEEAYISYISEKEEDDDGAY